MFEDVIGLINRRPDEIFACLSDCAEGVLDKKVRYKLDVFCPNENYGVILNPKGNSHVKVGKKKFPLKCNSHILSSEVEDGFILNHLLDHLAGEFDVAKNTRNRGFYLTEMYSKKDFLNGCRTFLENSLSQRECTLVLNKSEIRSVATKYGFEFGWGCDLSLIPYIQHSVFLNVPSKGLVLHYHPQLSFEDKNVYETSLTPSSADLEFFPKRFIVFTRINDVGRLKKFKSKIRRRGKFSYVSRSIILKENEALKYHHCDINNGDFVGAVITR